MNDLSQKVDSARWLLYELWDNVNKRTLSHPEGEEETEERWMYVVYKDVNMVRSEWKMADDRRRWRRTTDEQYCDL